MDSKQNKNEFMQSWYIRVRWLLPIIGTVVLIVILCYRLDLHQIADLIQRANWTFLVIASILTLPFVLLKTLKWHQLLKTDQPQTPYTLALRSFLIGIGASLFTPARVGELARIACFPRQRSEVFTLVIADKFIDMSTLLGVFVLSLALLSQGAFTGASEARKGAVQQAEGGTLFLDEIGEIPLEFQAKLLRVIDMKTVSPLGGTETLVDVRIIAASNRDLKTAVRDGVFRSDLFHRLNTLPVYLPPLRERRTDISALVDYFLGGFIIEFQRSVGLETDVYPLLEGYPWLGNVRELESLLKRVFLLTEKSQLNATDFAPHLSDETEMSDDTLLPLEDALARYEEQYLRHALEQTGGNRTEAARLLNIPDRTFYRKLAKYNL